jgi:hypothetical protein
MGRCTSRLTAVTTHVSTGSKRMYGHAGGFKHHGHGSKKPKSAGLVHLRRKYDNYRDWELDVAVD